MSHEIARRQLERMKARLRLDPTNRLLRLEIAAVGRRIARLDPATLEPLPALITQLARGEITTATAAAAITRDLTLATQVAAVALPSASTGDVTIHEAAGGNIYHIHLGGPDDRTR